MKTETESLRELDAWIAVNLFGKKAISKDGPPPTKGVEDDYFVKEWVDISGSLPHYSTDPAAAMEVLKKCAQKLYDEGQEETVSVGLDAPYFVVEKTNCVPDLRVEAPTLETAICKFAKKLFSK